MLSSYYPPGPYCTKQNNKRLNDHANGYSRKCVYVHIGICVQAT